MNRLHVTVAVCVSILASCIFSGPANAGASKPSSPAITKVSVSSAKKGLVNVKVSISLPISNGGARLIETKVSGGGKTCIISKSNTSCTLMKLPRNKSISIKAASRNSRGIGKNSLSVPFKLTPSTTRSLLYFASWSDYFDPNLLKRFTSQTGIQVVTSTYDSNETLLTEMRSGIRYDVGLPSDYMVKQMISLRLLTKINARSMANGSKIMGFLTQVNFDPNRYYSAPYLWGSTGIACNTALEPRCSDIQSWNDWFTIGFPKMQSLRDQVEVVSAALRATGVSSEELCTTDASKYTAVQNLLNGFSPSIIDNDSGIDAIVNGDIVAKQSWSGTAHLMRQQAPGVIYIYPREGLNFWSDNFVVPKNSASVNNAKRFISWMMDPKNAATATNYAGYMNGITGSAPYLSSPLRNDPAINIPADKIALLSVAPNCSDQARDLYGEVFINWADSR